MSEPNTTANSTPLAELSIGRADADGNGAADAGPSTDSDGPHPQSHATGLELANLMASTQFGDLVFAGGASPSDAHSYEGHVALALDPGVLADIDSALDLLTSTHQLFDVPVLDVASGLDDALPA